MPDSTGKMSQLERDKIAAWVNKKTKNGSCPVCGSNSWVVLEHLMSGAVFTGPNLIIGGPNYPQAVVVCNNCAYARTFMAIAIGVIPPDSPIADSPPNVDGPGNG